MNLSSNLLWIVILTILISFSIVSFAGYRVYRNDEEALPHLIYNIVIIVLMFCVIGFVSAMQCPAVKCPTNVPPANK